MKRVKQAKERCRKIISEHFKNAGWLYNEFVHTDNPDHLSHLEYMLFQFFELFYRNSDLKESKAMRLAPMFCRLAFQECNFQQNDTDFGKLNILTSILGTMYEKDLKGEINLTKVDTESTYNSLKKQFYSDSTDDKDYISDDFDYIYLDKSSYKVVGPLSFDEASKIGKYSCPESKLCYTTSKSTWDNYSSVFY